MPRSRLDPLERAGRHPIERDGPAVRFFEGALLGNGGLGAVVMLRPDALVVALGHNAVWDIRVQELAMAEIGTFAEVFARVAALPADLPTLEDDPWYADYCRRMAAPYRAPYPRPFPCGALILGFDRRRTEALGYRLDLATGRCDIRLRHDGAPLTVELFVEVGADRLWLRALDAAGQRTAAPFDRVRLLPDPKRPADLPAPTFPAPPSDGLAFRQTLPKAEPRDGAPSPPDPADRAFRVDVRLAADLRPGERPGWTGRPAPTGELERAVAPTGPFVACLGLAHGPDAELPDAAGALPRPSSDAYGAAEDRSRRAWAEYWARSGVALADDELERVWYRNLYFLNCAVAPGVTCPGLWANWSLGEIGTAWHGDYHMNYNTQQPFWVTFATNHVDKHLPYVDLVDHLLPLAERWAKEYYGLGGACFPHSAYPTQMTVPPYPVPTWGWEICETPWTVQSLWWHYAYTRDEAFLRDRALGPLRAAVRFLADYLQRPEASGPQWGDDRVHLFPSIVPELYGLTPGLRLNHDCLIDLTLTRFVFAAYLRTCAILGIEATEGELPATVRGLAERLPPYATAASRHGPVFVAVPGEDPDVVHNVPVPLMTVFPGEEHGLGSDPETYALAANTLRNVQVEGGNDLVFLNLQAARLGLLDLDRFKRQIAYCLLPNGTCTDMVLQVHGRYRDELPFDFMAPMGIWLENFALPLVVAECLLQSHDGTLRLFPNWPRDQAAEFRTLRAVGAFLVSAAQADGAVAWVEVESEAGGPLRLRNPWPGPVRCLRGGAEEELDGEEFDVPTAPGETLVFVPFASG